MNIDRRIANAQQRLSAVMLIEADRLRRRLEFMSLQDRDWLRARLAHFRRSMGQTMRRQRERRS